MIDDVREYIESKYRVKVLGINLPDIVYINSVDDDLIEKINDDLSNDPRFKGLKAMSFMR